MKSKSRFYVPKGTTEEEVIQKARGVRDDPAGADPKESRLLDTEALIAQLEIDEGVVYRIYLDSEGLATFGIGHLITKSDPEYGQPVFTPVSAERVHSAFEKDMSVIEDDLRSLVPSIEEQSQEVRQILGNMAFNLGRSRLGAFKNALKAIEDRDYIKAAAEMRDSVWFRQVGSRAKRLVKRMKALGSI